MLITQAMEEPMQKRRKLGQRDWDVQRLLFFSLQVSHLQSFSPVSNCSLHKQPKPTVPEI